MCPSKHVEQLRNIGIINSTTRSHLVGYFYKIYIMMHGSINVKGSDTLPLFIFYCHHHHLRRCDVFATYPTTVTIYLPMRLVPDVAVLSCIGTRLVLISTRHPAALTDGFHVFVKFLNSLNPELNPICYLLALLAHPFLRVSRIRVKSVTLRLLMSYIYGAPILDVSRAHTTTQHSR